MPRWLMMVATRCTDAAREAEFNDWYDRIDVPDVLEVPGYQRARRGELVDRAVPAQSPLPTIGQYVALYNIDSRAIDKTIIDMLMMAVQSAGRDVGAMSVEKSGVETMIRGLGFVRDLKDVEDIVIRGNAARNAGLKLKDIATVHLGGAVRIQSLEGGSHRFHRELDAGLLQEFLGDVLLVALKPSYIIRQLGRPMIVDPLE